MSILTRKEELIAALKKNSCKWFLTANPNTVKYLMDKQIQPFCILALSENAVTLIVPEGTVIENADVYYYPWYSSQMPVPNYEEFVSLFDRLNLDGRIGIEKLQMPAFTNDILKEKGCQTMEMDKEVRLMTQVKDAEAINHIGRCLTLNSMVYASIRKKISEECTELDVFYLINQVLGNELGKPVSFVCDILSGERTLEIGGTATSRQLLKGDTLIVDLLVENDGYYSDTTRTFFVGEITDLQRKAYSAVLVALRAGESLLGPGVSAASVNAAIKESLQKSGYIGNMPHHSGHGVGFSMYEPPYFVEHSQEILREGMVVTLEPGTYLPEKFGIRVENVYLITSTGFKNLFDCSENYEDYCL